MTHLYEIDTCVRMAGQFIKMNAAALTLLLGASGSYVPASAEPVVRDADAVASVIARKTGEEVRFIDVNKDRSKANEYKIQLIPTQVFLDSAGVEFHRHEGFYPEEEIDKLLADKGLKQIGGTAN